MRMEDVGLAVAVGPAELHPALRTLTRMGPEGKHLGIVRDDVQRAILSLTRRDHALWPVLRPVGPHVVDEDGGVAGEDVVGVVGVDVDVVDGLVAVLDGKGVEVDSS
ncbi:hypothetical protein [Luteimicrobium subarcticum]|uniref:hypothetical protein n=1 Tax=Luteimicrobium subarcticum TaxID=620910 RepID=UPI001FE57229|nr:hypothetical protein [Luteimicrobium subarcticum]